MAKALSATVRRRQSLRNAAVMLEGCEGRFEKGDSTAILDAVFWSAVYGIALPIWASDAFKERYRAVKFDLQHKSWDQVWGRPPAKGRKVAQVLKTKRVEADLAIFVEALRGQGTKWDDIWDLASKKFKIGPDKAKATYHAFTRFYFPDRRLRKVAK